MNVNTSRIAQLLSSTSLGSVTETSDADERYVPAPKVSARYDISDMTLYRWCRDDRMQFPRPIYFGRLRYWRLSDLLEFERRSAAASARDRGGWHAASLVALQFHAPQSCARALPRIGAARCCPSFPPSKRDPKTCRCVPARSRAPASCPRARQGIAGAHRRGDARGGRAMGAEVGSGGRVPPARRARGMASAALESDRS